MKRTTAQAGAWPLARLLVMACVSLAPLACGSTGPNMAPVSGKVTYQGKPVPKGSVTFASTAPDVGAAIGALGLSSVEWKLDGVRVQAHRFVHHHKRVAMAAQQRT